MDDKEWAINLVKTLNIGIQDNDPYFLACRIKSELHCRPGEIEVCDGASKMCIVPKDKPFVIKWSCVWNDDDSNFSEAVDEVEIYRKAVNAGLGNFFPKTAVLFDYNGITFVVQEKVSHSVNTLNRDEIRNWKNIGKTVKDCFSDRMEKEFNKASRTFHRELSPLWAKAVISLYGKKMAKRLCKFIIENKINDLHENNLGIKNGKPVILDFSGYHRND